MEQQENQYQEQEEEFGPGDGQESYEDSVEENLEDSEESSNQVDSNEISQLRSQLDEERRKSQENIRGMQSTYDRKIAELTVKLEAVLSQQQNNQPRDETPNFVDEDGDPRPPTPEEIVQLVEKRVESVLNKKTQQKQEQEQQSQAELNEMNRWMQSQHDYDKVLDFYEKNMSTLESEMQDLKSYDSRYMYVRSKILENELKNKPKKQNKPNVPPVGNSGQQFSSRPTPSNGAGMFTQAIEARAKQRRERVRRFRGR